MNNIIKFENVVKKYGKLKALDELTFSISEGSCTALVGNNGCGKTTTIYVIGNITNYNDGKYYYKNKIVTPKYVTYKNDLGMILSEHYYIEDFSTVEYLKFVSKYQNVPKQEIGQRIDELLGLLELENEKNKIIKDLSSGNQMKVTIASSLIHNPGVLVLDEPFINLDINTTQKLMELLKSLKKKKTIFITSHNLDLVAELCDDFLIMEKGKIITKIEKAGINNLDVLKDRVKRLLVKDKTAKEISWLKSQ
ncbi:MAG: ATP-binding cassette domain-containing protein [Candidatus Thorarchaeota archaeon]